MTVLKILFGVAVLAITVWGIVLCFNQSILLGIGSLLFSPAATIVGLVELIWDKDLAAAVYQWLTT